MALGEFPRETKFYKTGLTLHITQYPLHTTHTMIKWITCTCTTYPIRGGQLDNTQASNLPVALDESKTYIYNPMDKRYEVLDLKTGRLLESTTQETSPTTYSVQLADEICDRIRSGESLQMIYKDHKMPTAPRFYHWLSLHPELRSRYEQARLQRADYYHDRALEIGTSMPSKDDVAGMKLAVDTLKWAAEKASPNYYGSKKEEVTVNQPTVIIMNTGIDRAGAPSLSDLLTKKEPVTIEAEVLHDRQEEAT